MKILVTGGAGYIGAHVVRQLLSEDHQVVVYDNLCNGHRVAIPENVEFINGELSHIDLQNGDELDAVVHLAGAISVEESMKNPMKYYENNVVGTLRVLAGLRQSDAKNFVFASSAAVYATFPQPVDPVPEMFPKTPMNVYGVTKLECENMIQNFAYAYGLKYVNLRLFNVAGSDNDGENGQVGSKALIPNLCRAALGQEAQFNIHGAGLPTPDGSSIRDFVHVSDVARAFSMSVKYLADGGHSTAYNIGSGKGTSVLQVLAAMRDIMGVDVLPFPVLTGGSREGNIATLTANIEKANRELGWKPRKSGIDTILKTAYKWHEKHPQGY